ncbi:hypothetical protein [Streptomyces griseofuscus]|uniref:Uncharacterized protein n=1 Tax=Streptomyces griseofuscus TaxID=146922 RepID=A0A426SFB4_9ACTN|nr:hypothetical protein [Streptomyces griseofuscus]RRQ89709.1 hypothetical protein CQW44_03720 [Streptomyces griseofuscus]
MSHASAPVLVLGNTGTPSDVEHLRHVAWNVAYELGAPVVFAMRADYRVTDFAAVYLANDLEAVLDAPTLVLLGEALLAGIDVHDPLTADEAVTCDCGLVHHYTRPHIDAEGVVWCQECCGESACTWCLEWNDVEDLTIVRQGDTFIPLHAGCLSGLRSSTSSSVLPIAV